MVHKKGPEYIETNEPCEDFDEEGLTEEEYNNLNNQLDQLNGWLDDLERKNDHIKAQIVELLQQQRETMDMLEKTVVSQERQNEVKEQSQS